MITFRNLHHLMSFNELLMQMALEEETLQQPSDLLKRQLSAIYLIAYYQEDYKKYEGEKFYIEPNYDDVNFSIGGPTYLLEETIGTRKYGHEIILEVVKSLLKKKEIIQISSDEIMMFLINQAKCFVEE